MKLDLAFTKIDKYLQSKKSQPIIVDIQNGIDFEKLKERFPSSFYSYKNAGSYCKKDSYCRLDNLKNDLSKSDDDLFITGVSSFLRLQGKDELHSQLRILLDLPTESHVVIITYQCSKYLDFKDPRLYASNRIIIIEGDPDYIPPLTLVSSKISLEKVYSYKGIDSLDQAIEFNPSDKVFISTKHTESDFPKSLLQISTVSSAYDIIKTYEDNISLVKDDFGTVDEWSELLKRLQEVDNWETLVSNEFGGIQNLPFRIDAYDGFDEFKKWLYVLMLKLYSSEIVTGYLSKVLQRVSSYNDFVSSLFQTILNFDHTGSEFNSLYIERKCILKNFVKETEEICEYCKLASAKGKNGLFYLSDNTNLEKQSVIG